MENKEIQSLKELITSKDPNNVSLAFLLSKNYDKNTQDELFYHFLEIRYNSKKDWNSLKWLSLFNSQLQEIPDSIGNLTSLKSLQLHSNLLQELPDSIGNLASLERLDLDNNQLQELPESIENLTSLKTLFLHSNLFQKIPVSIRNLTSLEYLSLNGNPIPPEEQNKIKKLLPNCEITF